MATFVGWMNSRYSYTVLKVLFGLIFAALAIWYLVTQTVHVRRIVFTTTISSDV